ncbi:MAG: hypothetical protein U1F77_18695 [Kiritimatiellia bacterium]
MRGRDEHLPRLRISNLYRNLMMDEKTSPEVRRYILEKVKAGETLIKSISQRQSTIQRIAAEILAVQREFMLEGVLRPLTMAEVAGKIGVHETTVSRAISNKFIDTPQGLFELKYFFTPGFAKTADGQEVSNKSIKDVIQQLVDAETARSAPGPDHGRRTQEPRGRPPDHRKVSRRIEYSALAYALASEPDCRF